MSLFGWVHVILGAVAVISGMLALLLSKGAKAHRHSGRVFAVSMLLVAGGGAFYAGLEQLITLLVGITSCYLVISALVTVWPRQRFSRVIDLFGLGVSVSLALAFLIGGLQAPPEEHLPSNTVVTPEVYFFFAGIIALVVFGDALNLYLGGWVGEWRLARHLWRMGFALYIAAGSSIRLLPESLAGSPWPERLVNLLALIIALWWLWILFGRRFKSFLLPSDQTKAIS